MTQAPPIPPQNHPPNPPQPPSKENAVTNTSLTTPAPAPPSAPPQPTQFPQSQSNLTLAQHEFLSQDPQTTPTPTLISEPTPLQFFKSNQENYLVNNYALPRGLNSCQRVPVMSESEKFFDNRYSKQAIGEYKIKD